MRACDLRSYKKLQVTGCNQLQIHGADFVHLAENWKVKSLPTCTTMTNVTLLWLNCELVMMMTASRDVVTRPPPPAVVDHDDR